MSGSHHTELAGLRGELGSPRTRSGRARPRLGWRRLGGAFAVLATSSALLLGLAGVAQAHHRSRPAVASGYILARPYVNVRPGAPTLGPDMSRIIGHIPHGTRVQIDCVVNGPIETGPFGTTSLWDRLPGYQVNDPAAWVSDAWIYTGRNDAAVDNSKCGVPVPSSTS